MMTLTSVVAEHPGLTDVSSRTVKVMERSRLERQRVVPQVQLEWLTSWAHSSVRGLVLSVGGYEAEL